MYLEPLFTSWRSQEGPAFFKGSIWVLRINLYTHPWQTSGPHITGVGGSEIAFSCYPSPELGWMAPPVEGFIDWQRERHVNAMSIWVFSFMRFVVLNALQRMIIHWARAGGTWYRLHRPLNSLETSCSGDRLMFKSFQDPTIKLRVMGLGMH